MPPRAGRHIVFALRCGLKCDRVIVIHHAVKLRDRRARLHACAGDGIFFHFKAAGELCAAHAAARVNVIRAAFKHIAESVSRNAAVVVGRKICNWERERKRFAFARL